MAVELGLEVACVISANQRGETIVQFVQFWRVLLGFGVNFVLVFVLGSECLSGCALDRLNLPSTTGLVNFGLYKSTLIDRRENY